MFYIVRRISLLKGSFFCFFAASIRRKILNFSVETQALAEGTLVPRAVLQLLSVPSFGIVVSVLERSLKSWSRKSFFSLRLVNDKS